MASQKTVGELIPQPHGGTLRNGGPGSPGHPPNIIRRKALRALHDRGLSIIEGIIGDPEARARDRISAIAELRQLAQLDRPIGRAWTWPISVAGSRKRSESCADCCRQTKPNGCCRRWPRRCGSETAEHQKCGEPARRRAARDRDRIFASGELRQLTGLDHKGIDIAEIQRRLTKEVEVIRRECPPELAERLLDALAAEVWK